MRKIWCILILLIAISQHIFAGDYSYVYIEGDRQTPFYVKLEGEMMPRLGKNYCILPDLDAGMIHIQILFQQNAYPEQDFTIHVPEAGERGFVLVKVNDKQYALQDLKTKKYLVTGNTDDDAMDGNTVSTDTGSATAIADNAATPATSGLIPAFEPKKEKKKKGENMDDDDTRFMDNVALNTEKNKAANLPDFTPESHPANNDMNKPAQKHKDKPVKNTSKGIVVADDDASNDATVFNDEADSAVISNDVAIPNTDCPEAMSNNNFEDIAIKYLDREDDDSKLRYMTKTGIKYCYSTEQVRILAKNMDSQSARYELVTALYHRVVDQSNYSKLQDLFNSSYLRGKFMETLNQ